MVPDLGWLSFLFDHQEALPVRVNIIVLIVETESAAPIRAFKQYSRLSSIQRRLCLNRDNHHLVPTPIKKFLAVR